MDILTIDIECYYDNEYTLSKMTTEAYVRDPRFEPHMIGVIDGGAQYWLLPDRFQHFADNEVDWSDTAVICHHAHFDGLVLGHHFGVKPAMWIDTLSMARVLDGPKAGNSLHDLCIRHGIGTKGDFVTFAKGKHAADFSNAEWQEYARYCVNDCVKTKMLAEIFLPQMPADELRVIDLVIRMFTEPCFVGDEAKLRNAVTTERQRKIDILQALGLICPKCGGSGQVQKLASLDGFEPQPHVIDCKHCTGMGIDKKRIGSNEQLRELFRAVGREPETKTSPTTGEQILAFAKTDPAMQALLEDEDEQVRMLAEARIAIKSNIIETRAERFADAASRGLMPAYLSYGAAHTFRLGGGDSMNWQNLSGHNEKRPEMSVVKASVGAPPGFKCVRTDSSQGEARITAWNAGQTDLVEAFARGDDVYSEHASTVYGRPVDRKRVKEDFIPGQVGKISILGMGYGMGYLKAGAELLKGMLGAPPIQFTMKDLEMLQVDPSRFLNTPKKTAAVAAMPSRLEYNDRLIHFIVTEALVTRYRNRMNRISGYGLPAGEKGYWDLMEDVITAMINGDEMIFGGNGCMRTGKEFILMPNGLKLHYRGLERDQHTGQASYFDGRKRTKLHGRLLTENQSQCLHYILVSGQMLEIADAGLKVGLMTHDDVVSVVPDEAAEVACQFMVDAMSHKPAWAAGLPLAGEGKIGQTLLEVK